MAKELAYVVISYCLEEDLTTYLVLLPLVLSLTEKPRRGVKTI